MLLLLLLLLVIWNRKMMMMMMMTMTLILNEFPLFSLRDWNFRHQKKTTNRTMQIQTELIQ